MKNQKTVEAYIEQNQWSKELAILRSVLKDTPLKETIKWGTPHYTMDGKNLVGIAGFKSYFGLWFHNGSFLSDPEKKLINAQEGTTRGLRQWRFNHIDEIDKELLMSYLRETIKNHKAGKEIKPEKKALVIDAAFKEAIAKDAELSESFDRLSPGKKREYADHIAQAKQKATKEKRLTKIIPMIKKNIGLHDQYK